MKFSFGSWAFIYGPHSAQPLSFEEAARWIAEAGFDGIEVSGFPPHISLESHAGAESQREVRRMLADRGLAVSGYVPDLTMVNPGIEGNRTRYLDTFARYVDLCAEIGSPSIRIDTIAAPGSIPESEYAETSDRIASVWQAAAERAARSKVRVLWEFEPGFAYNKPSEVVQLYEDVGHSNFQILFDTAHAYLCAVVGARQQGEPEMLRGGVGELLDLLCGRIGHVHIVDTDGTLYGEETSSHCPLGKGVIDFQALRPKLLSVPGIEWWCVDLAFRADSELLLPASLEFVRKLAA